ncbi:MAG: thioredoxin domain-containing protein, partial [Atribacterota bacterium]|nr:thioredoxin domain-containing protein [Atribacterota bacterium]
MEHKKYQNRLLYEKSPYLQQHAHNPVNWFPWKEEAFNKANKENKPVFLSIGYSTCHWCHVMAHESFEDESVARLINEIFIPVKVDREERPDIDKVYIQVAILMTGSGGWPLTIFLTPDKTPFFAATYIPKNNQYGHKGLIEILQQVKELWKYQQNKLLEQGNQLIDALQKNSVNLNGEILTNEILERAYQEFSDRFDNKAGGFGKAPKFPSPHQLLFLLRYWKRTENEQALAMVEKTLQSMQAGGIFDHIGFGFHRYSTDKNWILPHFEKMLYDQALLSMSYLEAYQMTGKIIYSDTARKILNYVTRDMMSEEGGFYSAEDADSEGEEGKYYLWTEKELKDILDKDEFVFVKKYLNIETEGNLYKKGQPGEIFGNRNIFYKGLQEQTRADITKEIVVSDTGKWEKIREKLYGIRAKRIPPDKDRKILTDWNGLIIAALAKAAQVLEDEDFLEAAKKAADFIFRRLEDSSNHLLHRYSEGDAAIPGFLDDYAFLIWGLLELYKATFSNEYLQKALDLNKVLFLDFWDEKNGGFYFTSANNEQLLIRQKEVYDGAIPSGNSVAFCNLLKLADFTGNKQFKQRAYQLLKAFSPMVEQNPSAYAYFLT